MSNLTFAQFSFTLLVSSSEQREIPLSSKKKHEAAKHGGATAISLRLEWKLV